MRKLFDIIIFIIFAIIGPRMFGLIDDSTSIGMAAAWGAVFGFLSPFVGLIVFNLLIPAINKHE